MNYNLKTYIKSLKPFVLFVSNKSLIIMFFSLPIFRWQESIAGVSLDDICDIRERNCAARMLDINFVEEIAWLKYGFFLL